MHVSSPFSHNSGSHKLIKGKVNECSKGIDLWVMLMSALRAMVNNLF